MAHTPGPWTVEKRSATTAILHKPTDSIIGEVYGRIHGNGIEDVNARLIAAAPDLLKALERATVLLEEIGQTPIPVHEFRQVIARATGK